jgi:hypothetical protein
MREARRCPPLRNNKLTDPTHHGTDVPLPRPHKPAAAEEGAEDEAHPAVAHVYQIKKKRKGREIIS